MRRTRPSLRLGAHRTHAGTLYERGRADIWTTKTNILESVSTRTSARSSTPSRMRVSSFVVPASARGNSSSSAPFRSLGLSSHA